MIFDTSGNFFLLHHRYLPEDALNRREVYSGAVIIGPFQNLYLDIAFRAVPSPSRSSLGYA